MSSSSTMIDQRVSKGAKPEHETRKHKVSALRKKMAAARKEFDHLVSQSMVVDTPSTMNAAPKTLDMKVATAAKDSSQSTMALEALMQHSALHFVELERRLWQKFGENDIRMLPEDGGEDMQEFRSQMGIMGVSFSNDPKTSSGGMPRDFDCLNCTKETTFVMSLKSLTLSMERLVFRNTREELAKGDYPCKSINNVMSSSFDERTVTTTPDTSFSGDSAEDGPEESPGPPSESIGVDSFMGKKGDCEEEGQKGEGASSQFPPSTCIDQGASSTSKMGKVNEDAVSTCKDDDGTEGHESDISVITFQSSSQGIEWGRAPFSLKSQMHSAGDDESEGQYAQLEGIFIRLNDLQNMLEQTNAQNSHIQQLIAQRASDQVKMSELIKQRDELQLRCFSLDQVTAKAAGAQHELQRALSNAPRQEKQEEDIDIIQQDAKQKRWKWMQRGRTAQDSNRNQLVMKLEELEDAHELIKVQCNMQQERIHQLEDDLERSTAKALSHDARDRLLHGMQEVAQKDGNSFQTSKSTATAAEAAVAALMAKVESLEELLQEAETRIEEHQAHNNATSSKKIAASKTTERKGSSYLANWLPSTTTPKKQQVEATSKGKVAD